MTFQKPFTIHEAEIAIWHAWPNGMPHGDHEGNANHRIPLAKCKSSLRIQFQPDTKPLTGPSEWRSSQLTKDSRWSVSLSGTFGHWLQDNATHSTLKHPTSDLILVARWTDSDTGEVIQSQFHYTNIQNYEVAGEGEEMRESVTLSSSHMELFQGAITDQFTSDLFPEIYGRLEWSQQDRVVTSFLHNPKTGDWLEQEENKFGDTGRHIYFGPTGGETDLLHLSHLDTAPVEASDFDGNFVKHDLKPTTVFTIREDPNDSPGLKMENGSLLQLVGCPEVVRQNNDTHTKPVVIFRYLRRVYASIRNGTMAIPHLCENSKPPATSHPAFHLRTNGTPHPKTNHRGLLLLPQGAHLSGNLQ